jgi:ergothioneine biosynthesis protein EgtB
MHGVNPKKSPILSLAETYLAVRGRTVELCAPLETEDFVPQPVADVSPPRWTIAHTTWFFEEMILRKFDPDYKVFDESYGYFFNSYYNTIGSRTLRHKRGDLSRPTVKQIFAYREYVDRSMTRLLETKAAADLRELVVLGLNHEQQHQELFLTDLKYIFGCNPAFPVYSTEEAPEEKRQSGPAGFVEISGGLHEIGYNGTEFCFDNELGRHKVFLEDFAISGGLVTAGEFLEFINDGGYRNFNLWHSEGWDWLNQNDITSPLYWYKDDNGDWSQFTLAGLRPLVAAAPVCHVSYYEAAAFAQWKNCRLPTEFEWEAASEKLEWGLRWEWTNSAYLPYPNFKKAAGAVGEYNGKFMINQMVLRGASVATPVGHSRPTYRNFFNPSARWQFSGVRLAR